MEPAVEYLAKFKGTWVSVPMTRGTLLLGVCSRFDLLKEHALSPVLARECREAGGGGPGL
jgi:hypothetical protein